MKTYNIQMFPAAPVMNTTINGPAMQLRNMIGYSIQAIFVGTPTGTIMLEASSDPEEFNPGAPGPTNWTPITGSSQALSAAGNFMWNVSDVMYNWVRVSYSDSSGGSSTATLTAIFNGKGI